jgi:threonine/homoserine/homoserine lactone efflux protein
MKEALQSAFIIVLWVAFCWYTWRCCAAGSAHRPRGVVRYRSAVDHTIGSSFIGFFAGAYVAVKLGDLALK